MLIKGQVLHVFGLEGAAAAQSVFVSIPSRTGMATPIGCVACETKDKRVCARVCVGIRAHVCTMHIPAHLHAHVSICGGGCGYLIVL